MRQILGSIVMLALLLSTVVGCGSQPKERTLLDIERERLDAPVLFLTQKTHQEVLAPMRKGRAVFDSASGEFAWVAYQCNNPNCPGKGKGENGRPFLYIWPDPSPELDPDGMVSFQHGLGPNESTDQYMKRVGAEPAPVCPECLKQRERGKETERQKNQYDEWVVLHVCRENIEYNKRLNEEEVELKKKLLERKNRKVDLP